MKKNRTVAIELIFDIANYMLMFIILAVVTYPFLYVLSYSLSDPSRLKGGLMVRPMGLNLEAFRLCLINRDVLNGLYISVLRTVIGTFSMIVVTSMAAYAVTRDDLVGVKFIRKLFVFTMYFSSGLIPTYVLIKSLHLTGSFLVYILPGMISVFNLVLIKTYIESLPKSLQEVALIDGANDMVIFFKIIFPISIPVIAAVSLFSSVGQWNSFIDTQLYNSMNPKLYPLQYVLYNFVSSQTYSLEQAQQAATQTMITPQTMRMAITIITIIPILFVYPFLQKYFISGLLVGSVKG